MGLFSRKSKTDVGIALSNVRNNTVSSNNFPALENSSIWCCVTQLCKIFASLPLHLYSETGNSGKLDKESLFANLLKNPCPYLNSYSWRYIMHFNFEIHGVAMAIIQRTTVGDPCALFPVSPNCMYPFWDDGHLFWKYNGLETFPDSDILKFENTPISFTSCLCPVDYSQNELAIARSSQTLQRNFFDRATTLGGVVTVPRNTNQDVKFKLAEMFRNEFAGASNGYKTIVLEDNMKYEAIRLSEKDTSKMTEAQNFTLLQVSQRFGVPPFFLNDLTKATFANSEQQGTNLVVLSIQPRAVAIEEGYSKLLPDGQYAKYSLQGLMRGDHTARSAFYHNAIMDGWMCINEVRELEDLKPIKDGDKHFFPMNYTTISKVGLLVPPYSSEKVKEKVELTEKRKSEILFCEATKNITKSSRSQIESVIRKQLKAEIDLINKQVNDGASQLTLVNSFTSEIQSTLPNFRKSLEPIFESIMARLIPLVQKQCGTAAEVAEDDCAKYAYSYAKDVAERHLKMRIKSIEKKCNDTTNDNFVTDITDIEQEWIATVPQDESHEETARAGNCFNVFLFAQLGITYMHVVASADACEFCSSIDGKVVSVNGSVLTKGDSVSDGQGNVRVINKNYKNPPFHTHCTCGVAPGR